MHIPSKTGTRREQLILFLGLAKPLLFAVYADFADDQNLKKSLFYKVSLVPVERIELPTFGLQNRCSTAELNRHPIDFICLSELSESI